jgi:hypothetical protein
MKRISLVIALFSMVLIGAVAVQQVMAYSSIVKVYDDPPKKDTKKGCCPGAEKPGCDPSKCAPKDHSKGTCPQSKATPAKDKVKAADAKTTVAQPNDKTKEAKETSKEPEKK